VADMMAGRQDGRDGCFAFFLHFFSLAALNFYNKRGNRRLSRPAVLADGGHQRPGTDEADPGAWE